MFGHPGNLKGTLLLKGLKRCSTLELELSDSSSIGIGGVGIVGPTVGE